jgi:hypothetical protein
MRTSWIAAVTVTAVAAGWVGRSVFSDDAPTDPMGSPEVWAKLAMPGEPHARLKVFVGDWAVHVKTTMNDKVVESDGTCSFRSILGGRFIAQDVQSTFAGQPFEGHGWLGYDNAKKKLVGAWIDSMGTTMMTMEGDEKEPGKVWETLGTFSGPKGPITMRQVMTLTTPDSMRAEAFNPGSDKAMMTLEYTRKK